MLAAGSQGHSFKGCRSEVGFTAGKKLTSKPLTLMGSEVETLMGNCFSPKPFPQSSGGEAEEMAGAKITGTAFVFLNFCPAFQDLEQCCFAVLSQFLLSILPRREIWPAV